MRRRISSLGMTSSRAARSTSRSIRYVASGLPAPLYASTGAVFVTATRISTYRGIHRERRFGTFMRTIDLPTEVQEAHVSAKCKGGVLEVTVPKAEGSMPKAIRVDVVE